MAQIEVQHTEKEVIDNINQLDNSVLHHFIDNKNDTLCGIQKIFEVNHYTSITKNLKFVRGNGRPYKVKTGLTDYFDKAWNTKLLNEFFDKIVQSDDSSPPFSHVQTAIFNDHIHPEKFFTEKWMREANLNNHFISLILENFEKSNRKLYYITSDYIYTFGSTERRFGSVSLNKTYSVKSEAEISGWVQLFVDPKFDEEYEGLAIRDVEPYKKFEFSNEIHTEKDLGSTIQYGIKPEYPELIKPKHSFRINILSGIYFHGYRLRNLTYHNDPENQKYLLPKSRDHFHCNLQTDFVINFQNREPMNKRDVVENVIQFIGDRFISFEKAPVTSFTSTHRSSEKESAIDKLVELYTNHELTDSWNPQYIKILDLSWKTHVQEAKHSTDAIDLHRIEERIFDICPSIKSKLKQSFEEKHSYLPSSPAVGYERPRRLINNMQQISQPQLPDKPGNIHVHPSLRAVLNPGHKQTIDRCRELVKEYWHERDVEKPPYDLQKDFPEIITDPDYWQEDKHKKIVCDAWQMLTHLESEINIDIIPWHEHQIHMFMNKSKMMTEIGLPQPDFYVPDRSLNHVAYRKWAGKLDYMRSIILASILRQNPVLPYYLHAEGINQANLQTTITDEEICYDGASIHLPEDKKSKLNQIIMAAMEHQDILRFNE